MKSRLRKNSLIPSKSRPFIHMVENTLGHPAVIFGGLAVFLLFLSLTKLLPFDATRSRAQDLIAPVIEKVGKPFEMAESALSYATGFSSLQAENKQLRVENKRLNEWYQTAQLLRAENQSLRALLDVKLEGQPSFLTTKIVADPASPFIKSALLAAGSQDGVKKGQAVIGEGGLIGRVIGVNKATSRLLFINDINSRIPVVLEGTNQKAILAGTNDALLHLEFIPQTVTLTKGMRIVTSSDGKLLPAGLPVGVIHEVSGDIVTVMPFANSEQDNFVRLLELPDVTGP